MRDLSSGAAKIYLEFAVRRVDCRGCGAVKTEKLDWLADNARFTRRFADLVGRLCRESTVSEVARELGLDWHAVRDLDKVYMRGRLEAVGEVAPEVVGIDEISVGPRHKYRIVVSDLESGRPIWFGGVDRKEASLDLFYAWLGPEKSGKIRLAVMDMWPAFRNATQRHAPRAAIVYDKFHVVSHLNKALDQVRKAEYGRLTGEGRRFIKGKKYALLSRWDNLDAKGREGLRRLFDANRRLNTAYLLKEQFGQLWSYRRPGWARRFLEAWKDSLKWQRLKPFERFAAMVEKHWDGIEAYCHEGNKVKLGFVEALNNKIRVIQRKAYGFRDEEYLRLKILTCMLPRE